MSLSELTMSDGEIDPRLTGRRAEADAAAERTALTIRTVSRMFRVSPLLLRLYEWRGLIRRTRRGRAYAYSWTDCERVALITKARKVGLRLRHIEPLIKAMDASGSQQAGAAARERSAALVQLLEARQRALGDALSELRRIDRELAGRSKAAER